MKVFEEAMRYQYDDITPSSVILNVGAHRGQWAKAMCSRYDCRMLAFEPIRQFWREARDVLQPFPKCQVFNFGLGDKTTSELYKIQGDKSGAHADGPDELVTIRDVAEVFDEAKLEEVALFECNSEGGEFSILERMLDCDLVRRCAHLQIQPHHVVENYESRWQRIMDRLAETHETDWYVPWVWFGASLRK